jgi:LPPG:FO 2-phospho-L-lactate transferase
LITFLSGGTGTPKLLQGMAELIPQEKLAVVVNTGEDLEISGLYVSPDIDTVIYTLAGVVNEETWYGMRDDTFNRHEELRRMGTPELLRIGDRDREIKRHRTDLLRMGMSLSEATDDICRRFGIGARVMPMSNDRVRTVIHTDAGRLTFHEFWVARRARDRVIGVRFEGSELAHPAPGVLRSIDESDAVIIGPSNPVTSIGPILSVREIRSALRRNREKTIAVSPVIGRAPVSGPAGVLMSGLGHEVSAVGVARMYRDVAGLMLIDRRDAGLAGAVEEKGMRARVSDLLMPDVQSRKRLAGEILKIIGEIQRSP